MSHQTKYIAHYKLRCDECIGESFHVDVPNYPDLCECIRCGNVRMIPDDAHRIFMAVQNRGASPIHV